MDVVCAASIAEDVTSQRGCREDDLVCYDGMTLE